jgi:D-threo-aldose 1-dehydrogenase
MTADYTYEGTIRSIEDTLNRTGLGHIDLAIVHDIDRSNHGDRQGEMFREAMAGALPALHDLRRDGLIRAIGVGVNSVEVCLDCLAHADLDCFMLAGRYTLLDQSAGEALLPECLRREVGVIAAAPFNSGILARSPGNGEARYNYRAAPEPVVERARRIGEICARWGVETMTAALRFPLLHPAITAVLPGPRTPAQVHAAADAFDRDPPGALWSELESAGLLSLPEDLVHA